MKGDLLHGEEKVLNKTPAKICLKIKWRIFLKPYLLWEHWETQEKKAPIHPVLSDKH